MDLIWITQGLLALVVSMVGWFMVNLFKDQKNLRQVLQDTRERYVRKEDLKDLKQELGHRFDKLENLIQYSKDK